MRPCFRYARGMDRSSIGSEIIDFISAEENMDRINIQSTGEDKGKPLVGGRVKKELICRIASKSDTFKALVADLSTKYYRSNHLNAFLDMGKSGGGWSVASPPMSTTTSGPRTPGLAQLLPKRFIAINYYENPPYHFSIKYPESKCWVSSAESDLVNIRLPDLAPNVRALFSIIDDTTEDKIPRSRITPDLVASEFVVTLAHELRHTQITWTRAKDARDQNRRGRAQASSAANVARIYRDLITEENSTREVTLTVANEIGYRLPERVTQKFHESKNLRYMPGGYVPSPEFVERDMVWNLHISLAEYYLLVFAIRLRWCTVLGDFSEMRAKEELVRLEIMTREDDEFFLKSPEPLRSWTQYTSNIAAKIKDQFLDDVQRQARIDAMAVEHVKASLTHHRLEKLEPLLERETEAVEWNRTYEDHLKMVAKTVFGSLLPYTKMYTQSETLKEYMEEGSSTPTVR